MDSRQPHCIGQRGFVMILVIVVVSVAFLTGVIFVATSNTTMGVSQTMGDEAQARQISESAMAMTIRYMEQTQGWSNVLPSGTWLSNYSLYGGTASVTGQFNTVPVVTPVTIANPSFEMAAATLATTPFANPPMSGVIDDWTLTRTASVVTGATIPAMGMETSTSATNGTQVAFITFNAVIQGTAQFSQTLTQSLQPNTTYTFSVDVGTSDLAPLLADIDLQLYAGSTEIVSSAQPSIWSSFTSSFNPSVLTQLSLNATVTTYTVTFTTNSTPPTGLLSINLYAQSQVGLVSSVTFDNVQLNMNVYDPATLTSIGWYGSASHVTSALVNVNGLPGPASIEQWTEP